MILHRDEVIKINIINLKKGTCYSEIIASIPHSSYKITLEMKQNMKTGVILANNDWFLNELYSFLNELDITTVSSNYSRYVIDVNRKIEDKHNHKKYTESLVYFKTTFYKQIYIKP